MTAGLVACDSLVSGCCLMLSCSSQVAETSLSASRKQWYLGIHRLTSSPKRQKRLIRAAAEKQLKSRRPREGVTLHCGGCLVDHPSSSSLLVQLLIILQHADCATGQCIHYPCYYLSLNFDMHQPYLHLCGYTPSAGRRTGQHPIRTACAPLCCLTKAHPRAPSRTT